MLPAAITPCLHPTPVAPEAGSLFPEHVPCGFAVAGLILSLFWKEGRRAGRGIPGVGQKGRKEVAMLFLRCCSSAYKGRATSPTASRHSSLKGIAETLPKSFAEPIPVPGHPFQASQHQRWQQGHLLGAGAGRLGWGAELLPAQPGSCGGVKC